MGDQPAFERGNKCKDELYGSWWNDYEALYRRAEAERRRAEELRRQAEEREAEEKVRSQPTTLGELIKGVLQLKYIYSFCRESEDAKLCRGVDYLQKMIGDLQVVCAESTVQLVEDL
ncbi:hypothetical protein I7I51_02816 [Histoplasma capsulatum]|uniref:Uncharacterized protein n=1 Tax=Ajellomyces capsulatus TaxID=5037 RepID=A0A8A1MRE3_AJECA|nr:hypothetical protein I7I51_02816 [Histoplasma capsulatum]